MIPRILLVDDEEAILFAFSKGLSTMGSRVDTAQTLEQARRLLTQHSYDAVIADLRLSGAGSNEGFDVIRAARETQESCRIILATAYGSGETRETVLRLGGDAYAEKPISLRHLRELLVSLEVISPG